jgi:hypothetical protein
MVPNQEQILAKRLWGRGGGRGGVEEVGLGEELP